MRMQAKGREAGEGRGFLKNWNACSSSMDKHEQARERTPEIEMQLKLIYIILTPCASFLIFMLV